MVILKIATEVGGISELRLEFVAYVNFTRIFNVVSDIDIYAFVLSAHNIVISRYPEEQRHCQEQEDMPPARGGSGQAVRSTRPVCIQANYEQGSDKDLRRMKNAEQGSAQPDQADAHHEHHRQLKQSLDPMVGHHWRTLPLVTGIRG